MSGGGGGLHGGRAGLLVAVSDVSPGLHVGLVAGGLVDHLTVCPPSAAVAQILLTCTGKCIRNTCIGTVAV